MPELIEGWYSDLTGHQGLILRLTEYPGADALGVLHDSKTDRVVIHVGPAVAGYDEAKRAADARVERLHALLKVAGLWAPDFGADEPFRVRPDGGRDYFASMVEKVYAFDRLEIEVEGAGADQEATSEMPFLVRLDELAAIDEDVAKVLRLLVVLDCDLWTGLYRVYEVVEAAERGWPRLVEKGWTSEPQKERFERTSNCSITGGDSARHGHQKHVPPSNPMTLQEGRAWLLALVQFWLAERLLKLEQGRN